MSRTTSRSSRRRGALRRWLRRGLLGVLALVGLVVLTVATVVFTSAGTGLALRWGLEWYSGTIDGTIAFESSDGSLAEGVTIDGLEATDRAGRTLVRVDRLRLDADPWAAMGGHVRLRDWRISGTRILVPPDDGYADLAPSGDESEPSEPPPPDRVGPELPLEISASLRVDGLEVREGASLHESVELVRLEALALSAHAEGTEASAWVHLAAELPGIRVDALDALVVWNDPVVTLSHLDVRSSLAEVALARTRADLKTLAFELPQALVRVEPRWLEAQLGRPLSGSPVLRVRGSGGPEASSVELSARLGSLGALELRAEGQLEPQLRGSVRMEARTVPERWLAGPEPGPVRLDTTLLVAEGSDGSLSAELDADCRGCDTSERPLSLRARAEASPSSEQGELWVDLEHGPSSIAGHATLDDELHAELSLTHLALEQLADVLGRFGVPVEVSGNVEGKLRCAAGRELVPLRCDVSAALERGHPVQEAAVRAAVSSEQLERWALELSELRVRAAPVRVELTTERARIDLAPDAIDVEGFDVEIATRKGRGRVSLGGQFRPEDESASIDLAVRDLDLAALDAIAPQLAARGRLRADASLTGSLSRPVAELDATITGAGIRGASLGRLTMATRYAQGQLEARASMRGGTLGRWTLSADAPLVLSAQEQALRADDPVSVQLRAEDVSLAGLGPLGVPDLRGELDVRAGMRGSLRQPDLSAEIDGRQLTYEDRALGELSVRAGYRRGEARAEVSVEHPAARRIHASATVPVTLELESGRARWQQRQEHQARVGVEDLDLEALQEWTSVPLQGRLSLDARGSGSMHELDVGGTLRLDRIVYDERPVASGGVEFGYRDERISVAAHASGDAFEGLGLTASAPVTLDPARGGPRWHPARDHQLDLYATGIVLARLAGWTDPAPDVAGRVDLRVRASGDAADPEVTASIDGQQLAYGKRTVGEVSVTAALRDHDAEATVQWTKDARRFVRVRGRTPLRLDPKTGLPRWSASDEHRLTVEAPRIDPVLLEPLVELPEELDFALSLHGIAQGNLDAHSIRVASRGFGSFGDARRQPIEVKLRVDEHSQRLDARVGGDDGSLVLGVATRAPTVALAKGTIDPTKIPVDASLSAPALSLALFEPLAPEQLYDVRGKARIDATMTGTVSTPELSGSLEIDGGAVTLVELRQRLDSIRMKLVLAEDTVTLPTLSLRSGGGTLSARGEARLKPDGGVVASARLHGERLPVRRPGLPFLEVTTDLSSRLDLGSSATDVAVDLRGTRIDVISTNVAEAKPIPSHPDVRYVTALDQPERPTPEEEAEETSESPPRSTKLQLRLLEPLRVRGPAVDMAWTGEVVASGRGDRLDTRGSMTLREGFFELLNNRFSIDEGKVTIPPADDLRLYADITASAVVDEIDVSATIRGALPRPELTLTSTPSYSESQLFALLLTGTADFEAADPERVQAQAASLLAAFSSPALQRQINDRLRVDRIGLGVGESTNQPILSVEKSLTRKVSAETRYHHNAPDRSNRAELRVRYRFAPRWSLETFVGDAAVAGLDLFWGRVFDSRSRAPAGPREAP